VLVGVAILASFLAGFAAHRIDWLNVIVVSFTYYGVILLAAALLGRRAKPLKNDVYRPFVTVMVAARNEEMVIEATVRSLAAMNYKKNGRTWFEVLVLDDRSTDGTWAILQRLTREISHVRAIHRDPAMKETGKSAVLNHGLRESEGEILAVFDADSVVDPNFLKKAIPYLYDERVGGVQGRVRIYNAQKNFLTALQEDEFAVIAHLTQMGKDFTAGFTALGGNGQLTRRSVLERTKGWNVFSTTEDLDLSLQMLLHGSIVRYCPEAVVWQEGVETWYALQRQRARWAEGFLKCLFDYTPRLLFARAGFFAKLDAVLSLLRILIPLWLWVFYLVAMVYRSFGIFYAPDLSAPMYVTSSWAFFIVMMFGMLLEGSSGWLLGLLRVARYWIYSFMWVWVVPIGFYNTLKNLNGITWDKTFHGGRRDPLNPVISPAPAVSLTPALKEG
jgi:1,2-diacylglycerol 3-beta-glucosyltransferase